MTLKSVCALLICPLTLLTLIFVTSCSRDDDDTSDTTITNVVTTTAEQPSSNPQNSLDPLPETVKEEEEGEFIADLTITIGDHPSGDDLLKTLVKEKHRVSKWSTQALSNPDFPVAEEEKEVDIVVISMLDMGFLKNELVPLKTILKRGKKIGLEICSPEIAAQIRRQFIDQPDWSTGDRLGEFFVASEAVNLYDDGIPKIFSVIRDDEFPHPDTGIGLWLISNNVIDAADAEQRDRLFDPTDPSGVDLGGRFAFVIPPNND